MAENVFGDALAAGAILTGFCGTFLSFRIQREAEYHRKPASQPDSRAGRAAHIIFIALFGQLFDPDFGKCNYYDLWNCITFIGAVRCRKQVDYNQINNGRPFCRPRPNCWLFCCGARSLRYSIQ